MTWKKYFKDANMSPIAGDRNPQFAKRNYSSYLPDVYTGHPNRIQRYFQYDQMDLDSEVNAALDILAEFCTQYCDLQTTNLFSSPDLPSHLQLLITRTLCNVSETLKIFYEVLNDHLSS